MSQPGPSHPPQAAHSMAAVDPNSTVNMFHHGFHRMYILQSHLANIKALLNQANQLPRIEETNLEATRASENYDDKLRELWSAVENLQIRIQNEKRDVHNTLMPELLNPGHQLWAVPGMECCRDQVLEYNVKLAPLYIFQNELVNEEKELEKKVEQKQNELIDHIRGVGNKMKQAYSESDPRNTKNPSLKVLNITITRNVINSLLSSSLYDIDFEEHPNLLDLKIKWRSPIKELS